MLKNKKSLIVFFIIIIFILIKLANININLVFIKEVESLNDNSKNYIWNIISTEKSLNFIENDLGIDLPKINFKKEYMYLGYGRKINKIKYSFFTKYFSLHRNNNMYPSKIYLDKEYIPRKVYVYIGNKFVPPEDCLSSYIIE